MALKVAVFNSTIIFFECSTFFLFGKPRNPGMTTPATVVIFWSHAKVHTNTTPSYLRFGRLGSVFGSLQIDFHDGQATSNLDFSGGGKKFARRRVKNKQFID